MYFDINQWYSLIHDVKFIFTPWFSCGVVPPWYGRCVYHQSFPAIGAGIPSTGVKLKVTRASKRKKAKHNSHGLTESEKKEKVKVCLLISSLV